MVYKCVDLLRSKFSFITDVYQSDVIFVWDQPLGFNVAIQKTQLDFETGLDPIRVSL